MKYVTAACYSQLLSENGQSARKSVAGKLDQPYLPLNANTGSHFSVTHLVVEMMKYVILIADSERMLLTFNGKSSKVKY